MKNKALIAIGLLLAAVLPVSAYHMQAPQADTWMGAEGPLILCESNGWWDSVNSGPAPRGGIGGNCYAWPTVAAPVAGAPLPAGTCTQSTLVGAALALELTPGCQTYAFKPMPVANSWVCVVNTLTAQLVPAPPGAGGLVPTTWRVGSFQMQGASDGACYEANYGWFEGSHVAAFPASAWSEPFPGVVGIGNVPGATGVVTSAGPFAAPPVWCTAGGGPPLAVASALCVNEALVAASLYV